MIIDIRATSLEQAIKKLEKSYTFESYYRLPDTNIYRFADCKVLPIEPKEIDYKRAEKKFLVFNR